MLATGAEPGAQRCYHRRVRPLRRLLLLTLLAPAAFAAAQVGLPYTEEIEVRVINVDVVVTGPDGKPVEGLDVKDFELFEDGRPVEITNFSRVVEGKLDLEPETVARPTGYEAFEAVRSPLTWAIYVDQSNVSPGRRNQAIRELRKFVAESMQEGDRGIIASYDGFTFRVHQAMTTERAKLLDGIARVEKQAVRRGPTYVEGTALRAQIQAAEQGEDAGYVADRLSWLVEQEATRTKNAILSMRSFLDVVSGGEGRMALIYVGAGFDVLPGISLVEPFRRRFPDMQFSPQGPKPEEHQPRLEREVRRLIERIGSTRATVYTIHAGDEGASKSAEDGGSMDFIGGMEGDRAELMQAGIVREIAERTGGRGFKSTPGLATQLRSVATDMNLYYSLGYAPKGKAGTTRDVRVRVKVPGARVRHRESVRERSAEEQAEDAVVAALFDAKPVNPLAVVVEPGKTRTVRAGAPRLVSVAVKVPLKNLTLLPGDSSHRASLVFHFAAAGEDGSVWRMASKDLPIEIPHTEISSAVAKHITYSVEVPLLTRGMRLSVSVLDQIGQVRSLVTLPLKR